MVATARLPQQLDNLVTQFGDAIYPLALDVTHNDQVVQAVDAAVTHFGRLDVVVNNAGYDHLAEPDKKWHAPSVSASN